MVEERTSLRSGSPAKERAGVRFVIEHLDRKQVPSGAHLHGPWGVSANGTQGVTKSDQVLTQRVAASLARLRLRQSSERALHFRLR